LIGSARMGVEAACESPLALRRDQRLRLYEGVRLQTVVFKTSLFILFFDPNIREARQANVATLSKHSRWSQA